MPSVLQQLAGDFPGHATEVLQIPTSNPVNFHQVIRRPSEAVPLVIEALLVVPAADHPVASVMIVPGSAGVSPNHVAHAHTLVGLGAAVCLVDPFGARAVTSTVANQTQYSFAASAHDVLATLAVLARRPELDPTRISAQGHSRGGSAVMVAAMRPLADAVVGDLALAGVYAAYPWCGQQFRRPDVGPTVVRAIIGDQDDWCSVMAVQAQVQAIGLAGGAASLRVVAGAAHSFDRYDPVYEVPEARVSPNAPIEYLTDDGAMISPFTGEADPDRTDLHQFRDALAAGFGRQGAHMGSVGDQPALFVADMVDFHRSVLGLGAG